MEVASFCEALHVLPHHGGLFDQDPDWLEKIKTVISIRNERDRIELERHGKKK